MKERKITYTELKTAYIKVQNFLQDASNKKNINANTQISNDLGIDGDDASFLLFDFIETYKLNFEKFQFDKYFAEEGFRLHLLFILPLWLLILLIRTLFPQTRQYFAYFFPDEAALTMGDLVASLTEGEFTLRKDIRYVLWNE